MVVIAKIFNSFFILFLSFFIVIVLSLENLLGGYLLKSCFIGVLIIEGVALICCDTTCGTVQYYRLVLIFLKIEL
jgi:hypothetical protein